ncbi:MAG TPA: DUF2948 family protein [Pseudorhodoplanes sp.]|jgi:hypothetical protein|nr:DUF2948 family protein [Pseudorhodoplanes sp.]
MVDPLKLIALDKDDLEVVSAHLQDSAIKTGEVFWRPHEKRVVIALDRFDWEAAHGAGTWRRRRAALRFERVLSCKCKGVDCGDKTKSLNLLAIDFAEQDAPAGMVTLLFEGGAALRMEVECLEAELADLGPVWAADCCPEHDLEGKTATA